MRKVREMACRVLLLTIASGLLISCASAATRGNAQDLGRAGEGAGGSGTGPLKVLVLGEDGHDALIPRGDPAFRRVVTELQEIMDRRGFRVVDEEAVAADLGWPARDYRDKTEVLEAAKLANASERAASRVQAALLFRIEGTYRDLRYATRIDLHLSGDLYDVRSNRFLGAVDLPTERVTVPGRCLTAACGSHAVSARARDLASELGTVLARKLAALAPRDSATAAPVEAGAPVLEAVYTVTFRHLTTEEALSVIDVMTDGFPGYRSHDLLRGGGAVRRYEYVTTASAAKIERWLTLLLLDMGLDPEREIVLAVRDRDIRIERVLPATATTPQ
ncbi:hypothetical protein T8K17_13180 [Thalassobaculum sp. OXR-137]|uniref:hypothetical protein n=1 Tax=Thalassobaculum sp. OXR-137 TaxID=3100173 RepID=UPI002AC8F159|nr:hypothetical protein [Thalassobaculum sp. OXR-137]WPZ32194.1 hypothetical protein T8K17_13180 [Thalassobaculum sp. OXR-137]